MAFETSVLANANLKVDAMANDASIMKQYQPQVAGLKKIMQNQTATLNEAKTKLAESEKNYSGKVYLNWLTTENIVEEAISTNCSLSEPLLDSASQAYSLTMEFRSGFSINEDDIKNSSYSVEELIARGMLKAMQVLDEGYAKRAISKADALAGANLFPGAYTYAAGQTTIPANKYNESIFPYIARAAEANRLRNYFLIDGGELFEGKFLADMNGANADGKGLANLYGNFDITFDLVNFAKAGVSTDTLLIDRNSLAFITRNRFSNTVPETKAGQKRYKIASKTLPGVFYDVYYAETCITVNGRDQIVETFRLQTQGDLLKSPELTYPGVLSFAKGA